MPLPMIKIYFHNFDLHIGICLRYFYLQYCIYIYEYILNILIRLKSLFSCKSKHFLLIFGTMLSVFLRPDKNLQGSECPVKL